MCQRHSQTKEVAGASVGGEDDMGAPQIWKPRTFSTFLVGLGEARTAESCSRCSRSSFVCQRAHSEGASKVSPPCLVMRSRTRHMTGVLTPTPEMTAWPLVSAGR